MCEKPQPRRLMACFCREPSCNTPLPHRPTQMSQNSNNLSTISRVPRHLTQPASFSSLNKYGGSVVFLLFGPPGSGKGTQSRMITNWLEIPSISTGDMLRTEIQAASELGKTAQSIMAAGGLVGDDLVNKMLAQRISKPDCHHGFLLDGFSRKRP